MARDGSADIPDVSFLIFLASVAVLEHVLSRDSKRRNTPPREPDEGPDGTGLRQLGAALERYGRGQQPNADDAGAPAFREENKK
jgi:hypothetical protein